MQQGACDKALKSFQGAEAVEDELQWSSIFWETLYGKAYCFWQTGQPDDAERAFRDAISVIEALRDKLLSAESRAFFTRDYTWPVIVGKYLDMFERLASDTPSSWRSSYTPSRARSRISGGTPSVRRVVRM